MKFIRLLTAFAITIASTSVAHADLKTSKWQFFISYSDMKKDKNYLTNLVTQSESGKVTCITISSQKLADYLESLNTDTVDVTIDTKEKGRLDFVTIGSLPWKEVEDAGIKGVWMGLPSKLKDNTAEQDAAANP